MARTLEEPRKRGLNLRIYDDSGAVLAVLRIPEDTARRSINPEMLYRYCGEIMIFPAGASWAIFRLRANGATGRRLDQGSPRMVEPGYYVILDRDLKPLSIRFTDNVAPRRIRTRSPSSSSQARSERNQLQTKFRNSIRARDVRCVVSDTVPEPDEDADDSPFAAMQAVHIYPTSRISEWNQHNYRRLWMTDTRPASEIGQTGLFSPQNGLLLNTYLHDLWDSYKFGIDPDANYRVISFTSKSQEYSGRSLLNSARYGTREANNHVSPDLLRWHLRMCLYKNMKANAEPHNVWEEDLGSDDMEAILSQPDAAERMEVELFTRLGAQVA